jgi:hypothetical protein
MALLLSSNPSGRFSTLFTKPGEKNCAPVVSEGTYAVQVATELEKNLFSRRDSVTRWKSVDAGECSRSARLLSRPAIVALQPAARRTPH